MTQKITQYEKPPLAVPFQDKVSLWINFYMETAVSVGESSRQVKSRVLNHFLIFLVEHVGADHRPGWPKRIGQAYKEHLCAKDPKTKKRKLADRTVNNHLRHVKQFSKWVHKMCEDPRCPFDPRPDGDPMKEIREIALSSPIAVEKALTPQEEARMLDAADLLLHAGRSKDRNRYAGKRPPQRKNYRAYRNRALVYILIGTGCRIGGVVNLNLDGIDLEGLTITTEEKGGKIHPYTLVKSCAGAIREYLEIERPKDASEWPDSPAAFLAAAPNVRSKEGRLTRSMIFKIWKEIAEQAGVKKSPHAARHAMGHRLVKKENGLAKAKNQLGHTNMATTMCYIQPTQKEIAADLETL